MAIELPRKNIISFSGGKDSTALLLWAKENLDEYDAVWMDTGWEHEITYGYVDYIDKTLLDGKLIRLKSDKYDGFEDMVVKKNNMPSAKRRFCTDILKIRPYKKHLDLFRDEYEIHSYVGIRADESYNRSKMKKENFDLDHLGVWVHRPLLDWTAEDVFDIMKKHDIEPNPLYKMGMKRVGCMPCIMTNKKEMKQIATRFPEVIDSIRRIEQKLDNTYFSMDYVPDKYCSRAFEIDKEVTKTIDDPMFGEREVVVHKKYTRFAPTIDDVVKYIMENPDQVSMMDDEEPQSCMSHYNICE